MRRWGEKKIHFPSPYPPISPPLYKQQKLYWLTVVVIPEEDFMVEINANTRTTILVCIAALLLSAFVSILIVRWLVQPLLSLITAAKYIAKGEWDQTVTTEPSDELGTLVKSFNSMAQLQKSFETLESKNADLQEAKEQLEAVLNAAPGSISWMSADGLYLGVNGNLAERLNQPPEVFIGQEVGCFDSDLEFADFMRQFLASSEQAAFQMIRVDVNDSWRYYLVAAQKYRQGAASVLLGIDITGRKQAEEVLRLTEGNYRNIFENAVDGIFQSTPDGHYIRANPAMAQLYRYKSPAELMAMVTDIGSQVYVDPSNREKFQRLIEEQGEVKGFEYQVYRQDGTIIWVSESTRAVRDVNGKVIYYEGIIEDVTQRKQKEEDLQRQLQELRIEIDKNKQAQRVADIVKTDSFQNLKQRIQSMKKSREEKKKKPGYEKS